MGIFGDLIGCVGLIQDNHGQNIIGSAANPAIDVVLNLSVQNSGIGTLGCQDQVDAKGSSLPGDHGQSAFDFDYGFLLKGGSMFQAYWFDDTGGV